MSRIEGELPQKVVEEFKGITTFGDAAEEFLSGKIIEIYEILSGQILGVNPHFPFDKVKVLSGFLQWNKDQEAPPPKGENGSSSDGPDDSSTQPLDALE